MSSEGPSATGPLAGLKVVDVSIMAAGPWAGSLLGMLGADVIKIEPPAGDGTRWVLPHQKGMGTNYICLNVNKRDITLDLKSEADRKVALDLIAEADIFVQNFRGGVIGRLKLGWEDVQPLNPRLIYCSISGFGEVGPLATAGAADYVVQAFSGFAGLNGRDETDFEQFRFSGFVDLTTSSVAIEAVLAALIERETSGLGQKIELGMFEAALEMQSTRLAEYLLGGRQARPAGIKAASLAPDGAYETLDRTVFLTVHGDTEWRRFCEALERPDLAEDARFASNAGRVANAAELDREIAPVFAGKSAVWWLRILQRHGIASGVAHDFETFRHHEQVRRNGHIAEIETPWGQVAVAGTPWHFSRTPASVRSPSAPDADTETIVGPRRKSAKAGASERVA